MKISFLTGLAFVLFFWGGLTTINAQDCDIGPLDNSGSVKFQIDQDGTLTVNENVCTITQGQNKKWFTYKAADGVHFKQVNANEDNGDPIDLDGYSNVSVLQVDISGTTSFSLGLIPPPSGGSGLFLQIGDIDIRDDQTCSIVYANIYNSDQSSIDNFVVVEPAIDSKTHDIMLNFQQRRKNVPVIQNVYQDLPDCMMDQNSMCSLKCKN